MTNITDLRFRVQRPEQLFDLLRLSSADVIVGYDTTDQGRAVFNLNRRIVHIFADTHEEDLRWKMADFVMDKYRFWHAYLLTLEWGAAGGWRTDSPLELLALCSD